MTKYFLFKGSGGGCKEEEVLVGVPASAVLTNGLFIAKVSKEFL